MTHHNIYYDTDIKTAVGRLETNYSMPGTIGIIDAGHWDFLLMHQKISRGNEIGCDIRKFLAWI